MSGVSPLPNRRSVLVSAAAASAANLFFAHQPAVGETPPSQPPKQGDGSMRKVEDAAIRPFSFNASDEDLTGLRQRIAATKWPSQELVTDASQGVQLATMRELARYWQTDFDWRNVEARLNALPQFTTSIDGLDIHFIHVRSNHDNALPIIVTHGWPGSIIEQLKIIDPLTNPTAHGGRTSDAFEVVIPSLPGHGFSGKPTVLGWDPIRIARAWIVLMKRLGYTRYVAQGGDWGNAVTEQMALQAPQELVAIHTNMPATIPDEIAKALQSGGPAPSGLSGDEKYAYRSTRLFLQARPRLLAGDGQPSPDALLHRGFAGRPRCLDARPRRPELRAHRTSLCRPDRRPYARRRSRERHTLLADEHGSFLGPALLGKQTRILCSERGSHTRRRQRLPGRDLYGAAELDGKSLPQAHLLQAARQRRPFCGLGTAKDLRGRDAGGICIATSADLKLLRRDGVAVLGAPAVRRDLTPALPASSVARRHDWEEWANKG